MNQPHQSDPPRHPRQEADEKPPPPPRNDLEAKLRLDNLGKEAVRVLRDAHPKMYRELEKAGRLHLWAWEKQRAASDRLGDLIERGMRPDEAYESVASTYLDLPET